LIRRLFDDATGDRMARSSLMIASASFTMNIFETIRNKGFSKSPRFYLAKESVL
jgi:hypothetical protein